MRRLAVLAGAVVLLVGCSSSGKSSVDSGTGATTTSAAAGTAAPSATTSPATTASTASTASATGSSGTTATTTGTTATPTPTAATPTATTGSTIPAPTTTAGADLSGLPSCPTDALAAAGGPVQITVWHGMNGGVVQPEFERLVAQYNSSQDKVKVDAIAQGGYEEVIDRYLQSDQGSLPDVAQMPEYMVQNIVDTKTAVPIAACVRSARFDTSSFIAGALRAYSTGGVLWGMPFNISDPVLFYNRKTFAAAGLDPDRPPASIEEIRAASQKIVDSGAATYGLALESGFDSGGGWYLEQWLAQQGKFYADHDNGHADRATKVLYDDADSAALLTQLQSMIRDGLAVDVGDNTSQIDNLLKLADPAQPAAMTIATSAVLGSVISILQGGQFPAIGADDIGVAPMPGPGGAKGASVGGASLWITNSGNPARTAAAWDFVQYMVGAQLQSEWSAVTGYVAVRNDARVLEPLQGKLTSDPRFAVALDQLNVAPDAPTSAGPILGPLREVRTVTAQAVAAIFHGSDAAKSLADAARRANALIADYNSRNS